ncbi:MAG: tetratricopeptide repeat protein [Pseudomonadota bacterium]
MVERNIRVIVAGGLGAVTFGLTVLSIAIRQSPPSAALDEVAENGPIGSGDGGDANGQQTPAPNLRVADVRLADDPAPTAPPIKDVDFTELSSALRPAYERLVAGEFQEALWLAEPAANSGDPRAQHLVGYLLETGLAGKKDLSKAARYYARAADAGDVDAQVALGAFLISHGDGAADHVRAAKYFRLAANQGDARALARLGALYADGLGVTRDPIVALSLIERAAAKEDPDALFFLGMAHLTGEGRPREAETARRLLSRAVRGGHAEAAYNLALLYRSESLGEPDIEFAASLMEAAANVGYGPAMTAMGLYAHNGEAPGSAADWFERAAEAGDLQGRFLYAVSLAEGDGRPRDRMAAARIATEVASDPEISEDLARNVGQFLKGLSTDIEATTASLRE